MRALLFFLSLTRLVNELFAGIPRSAACRVHVELTVLPAACASRPGLLLATSDSNRPPAAALSRGSALPFFAFSSSTPPLGRPFFSRVENIGFEPMTPSLQS